MECTYTNNKIALLVVLTLPNYGKVPKYVLTFMYTYAYMRRLGQSVDLHAIFVCPVNPAARNWQLVGHRVFAAIPHRKRFRVNNCQFRHVGPASRLEYTWQVIFFHFREWIA